MSSTTQHHMSSMDPYKTDTDEFQQIQSPGSMGDGKICLKVAMLSL
jgi:hypothetical protein